MTRSAKTTKTILKTRNPPTSQSSVALVAKNSEGGVAASQSTTMPSSANRNASNDPMSAVSSARITK